VVKQTGLVFNPQQAVRSYSDIYAFSTNVQWELLTSGDAVLY
jgi:hypothetical protein